MQEQLIRKLYDYIRVNNPDIIFRLQRDAQITRYLQLKLDSIADLLGELQASATPDYIISERCMEALTVELRPSRFNYISAILEEEFEPDFSRFKENGILAYEVINMMQLCTSVFESTGFTEENEDNRELRYAITGTLHRYLNNEQ